MREEHPRFDDAGARLATVFMGPPPSVGDFCRDRDVPFDCFADPDRSGYRAFGLARGSPRQWLVGGGVIKGTARLLRKGVAAGLPDTGQDVRQLPGTFVVARGGTVRLAHYNRDSSDDPPVELLLGALGAA